MRSNIALTAILIAAIAAPAAARGQASSQSTDKPKATKYCIEYEGRTGSRLRDKECLTKEQWAKRGVDVDSLRAKD